MPTPTPVPWATPTPIPVSTDTSLMINPLDSAQIYTVAETAVTVYHIGNQQGYIDNALWIIILLITLYGLRRILKEIKGL